MFPVGRMLALFYILVCGVCQVRIEPYTFVIECFDEFSVVFG